MRSEMETSNGLFQQQNQTQMAVDNDLTMFTQTTHIQQNNNMATNTPTTTMVNNNETATPVAATTSVAAMPSLAVSSNMVASAAHEATHTLTHTLTHTPTPTLTPTPPSANRLHSVLSNSSSSSTSSPLLSSATLTQSSHMKSNHQHSQAAHDPASQTKILSKTRLQELVREVDATEQLDDDVEEILLQLADDFVETTVTAACLLAKHRKASTVEVRDVQLHLERNWNMWIPGFGTDELRPYKRSAVTEAHKQRLALIRKTLKKY